MPIQDDDESDTEALSLFQEPTDYYRVEKPPTFTTHKLKNGQTITLRLVGHNPLWGHLLWNAGQVISDYLEADPETLVKGKTVLELGAGAGLPSLTCAILGAKKVVVTDYPDADLIANLQYNIDHCDLLEGKHNIVAEGFLWGNQVDQLTHHLPSKETEFDLLILADILFNHSEHTKLVKTLRDCLKKRPSAQALVFFTPYRPWLFDKDLAFFDIARADGFVVEKILEHTMDKVMFEEDPGDELLRRTVFGYKVTWK